MIFSLPWKKTKEVKDVIIEEIETWLSFYADHLFAYRENLRKSTKKLLK